LKKPHITYKKSLNLSENHFEKASICLKIFFKKPHILVKKPHISKEASWQLPHCHNGQSASAPVSAARSSQSSACAPRDLVMCQFHRMVWDAMPFQKPACFCYYKTLMNS
jgi:hypothetical protein